MGVVGPLFGVMQAINGQYAAQSALFGAQDAQLALMDRAGQLDPARAAQFDKALALHSEMAKVRFAAYQAMLPEYQRQVREGIKTTFGNLYADNK